MMVGTYKRNLHISAGKMERLQSQLATNRKNVRLSDDAVSVVKLLNAKAKQSDTEQFQKNLDDASAWLTNTESALHEADTLVKRVYELAVYAANDVLGAEERESIALEVQQLRDQLLTLGNATLGDKYIFGGYNVSYPPFYADPETDEVTLNNIDMVGDEGDLAYMSYEIGVGNVFEVGVSGSAFMGVGEEDNVWYQMQMFITELRNPEQTYETLSPFISNMQLIENNILAQQSEVGGRLARIDLMRDRYSTDLINYTQMRSDVQDLDQAEGIMNFSMAEAVYRAALNVGGRVLQPTLMDFLR
jgi:flagellar hook-associated protein 3 FlgL